MIEVVAHPVALSLGGIGIRWYSLAYVVGILYGWWRGRRLCERVGLSRQEVDDFVLWGFLGVILGGRVGYVLFYNARYFWEHPLDILKIYEGGMSFHGGLLGVGVAVLVYGYVHKISIRALSDTLCVVVPVGLGLGRVANFVNVELWGRITEVPWGVVFVSIDSHVRHPSQLYEAFLEGLVLLVLMEVLIRVRLVLSYRGLTSGIFFIGYGVMRIVCEFFREPDVQIGLLFDWISMGQVLSVPLLLLGFYCVTTSRDERQG